MIDKVEIGYRFRKSVDSYDDNALAQKLIIKRLCELVKEYPCQFPKTILEIGCGTGLLTNEMQRLYNSNLLYINDLVGEMCSKTASRCDIPVNQWLVGDIENISFPKELDLIVSSSTFQWFIRPWTIFEKLAEHMVAGGFMIFSTFGSENMKELRLLTGQGLTYYPMEELKSFLLPYFDVLHMEENLHTLYFSHPMEILRHIKNTGVGATASPGIRTKGQMEQFAKEYACKFAEDGLYPLTYHPIYMVCRKKKL